MRAVAGKLLFAATPAIADRLKNTDTLPKPVVLVDTAVHSWLPIDVKPASIQVDNNGSVETIFITSVVIFVLKGHLSSVGLWVGSRDGVLDGKEDGMEEGAGVVGMELGTVEGNEDGVDEGSEVGKMHSGITPVKSSCSMRPRQGS